MFSIKNLMPFGKLFATSRVMNLGSLRTVPLFGSVRHISISNTRGNGKKIDEDLEAEFAKMAKQLDEEPIVEKSMDPKDFMRISRQQKATASSKQTIGWKLVLITFAVGGVTLYVLSAIMKASGRRDRPIKTGEKIQTFSLGRPLIGGPWELLNTKGKLEGSEQLKGNWLLIYFGFTHCPDICPDEIEKMIRIVDELSSKEKQKIPILPIFISIDPTRDTPARVKQYCSEFSPKLKGYTGSLEQVDKVAKTFRVYYSAGPRSASDSNDYIVDHSVILYLMNPEGNFQEFYGQNRGEKEIVEDIRRKANEYNADKK